MTQTHWQISDRSARWPESGRGPKALTSTPSSRGPRRTCSSSTTSYSRSTARQTDPSCSTACATTPTSPSPARSETFHDQVGYWLWEPAPESVTLTLGIPRAQVLLASGPAAPDATDFELTATVGSEVHGILSNPFLDEAFRTLSYRIHVTVHDDGTWSYEEEGVLQIPDRDDLFSHIDRNTLTRIGPPELNPLARAAERTRATSGGHGSLGIGSLRQATLNGSPDEGLGILR